MELNPLFGPHFFTSWYHVRMACPLGTVKKVPVDVTRIPLLHVSINSFLYDSINMFIHQRTCHSIVHTRTTNDLFFGALWRPRKNGPIGFFHQFCEVKYLSITPSPFDDKREELSTTRHSDKNQKYGNDSNESECGVVSIFRIVVGNARDQKGNSRGGNPKNANEFDSIHQVE